jgi:toxin ParE1/3/4
MVCDRIEQLAEFPGTGRPGEVKGARELVVLPYVVVYRHSHEIIEILHIWHGAQDWRQKMRGEHCARRRLPFAFSPAF